MDYNHLYWSNMDGPDITEHQSELELSNRVVFNRGQTQPGGKIYLKTTINIKPHLVVKYRETRYDVPLKRL